MKEILDRVLDEVRGASRFRWYALLAAWIICIGGWTYVLFLPNRYEASARVFVDPTTALRPVIKDLAIEGDVDAELNLVRQTLLSDASLRKVVQDSGLAKGVVGAEGLNAAIAGLRGRIEVNVQGSAAPGSEQQTRSKIYAIRYQDSDGDRALKVVTILLNDLVEGTLGGKRQGSMAAQRFLEDQIKDYEQRLAAAEEQLAQFKKQHVGMVPGEDKTDYFTRLQAEMDAVKKSQNALNLAMAKHDALQRQLRGETPIAASSPTTIGPTGTAVVGGDTLSRIKEAQARLDDLLLRFTEKHPDVIAMRQTLAELKARRASELEALRRGDPNAAALTGASSNPVYQSIQLALNQSEIDIAGLRGELADHEQKVTDLRKMVDTMPQVEAEYAKLNRDYGVTKAQYTALAERLEKARVGEEADASGSVRFEVIDPPSSSFKPVGPRRPLLMAAILGISLAAGGALAYGLNLLKPVYNSARALAAATGASVLGAISVTRSVAELEQRRSSLWRYSLGTASLFGLFVVAVLIARQYAPLGMLLARH